MQKINSKLHLLKDISKCMLGFIFLCIVNHFVSTVMFRRCGYCLVTYAVVYTFYLATVSLFLSTVVYNIFVRQDDQQRLLLELRSMKHEDIPFVMVLLLERIRERQSKQKEPQDGEIDNEATEACIACYDELPSIRNMPCGHVVLCSSCNWHLIRVSIENRSPLACSWCRTPVKDFEGQMRPNLDLLELQDIKDAMAEIKSRKAGESMQNHHRINY
eukprot:gene20367-22376_t